MKDALLVSIGPSAVTFETVTEVSSDFCERTVALVFEVALVSLDVRFSDSFAEASFSARSVTAASGLSLFSPAVFAIVANISLVSSLSPSLVKKFPTFETSEHPVRKTQAKAKQGSRRLIRTYS